LRYAVPWLFGSLAGLGFFFDVAGPEPMRFTDIGAGRMKLNEMGPQSSQRAQRTTKESIFCFLAVLRVLRGLCGKSAAVR
jgi:hypothetical protein